MKETQFIYGPSNLSAPYFAMSLFGMLSPLPSKEALRAAPKNY